MGRQDTRLCLRNAMARHFNPPMIEEAEDRALSKEAPMGTYGQWSMWISVLLYEPAGRPAACLINLCIFTPTSGVDLHQLVSTWASPSRA